MNLKVRTENPVFLPVVIFFYFWQNWGRKYNPYNPGSYAPDYLHGKSLVGSTRSIILLQRNPSFVEMLDQVHFSCRSVCWKNDKIWWRYLV